MKKRLTLLLLGLLLILVGCTKYNPKDQDTSKVVKLPSKIPETHIFNPHQFLDSTAESKIKEMNEKWIKDPIPVQVTVVIVEETLFSKSVSEINKIMLDAWNINDDSDPVNHIILFIDVKRKTLITTTSESLQKILPSARIKDLDEKFYPSFKGHRFSEGIIQYLDGLDHELHLTEQEKHERTMRETEEQRVRDEERLRKSEIEKNESQDRVQDSASWWINYQIWKSIFKK